MSVIRVGWSKKYGDNYDAVFGGKKKKANETQKTKRQQKK